MRGLPGGRSQVLVVPGAAQGRPVSLGELPASLRYTRLPACLPSAGAAKLRPAAWRCGMGAAVRAVLRLCCELPA